MDRVKIPKKRKKKERVVYMGEAELKVTGLIVLVLGIYTR